MSSANFKVMHETIIKDILDLIDDVKELDAEDIFDHSKRNSLAKTSMMKKTSGLIMTFPIMVSTSMSINTAVMIMKAIERKAAVMMQLFFASYQISELKDLEEIISKFHKNIKLKDKATIDDVISCMDRLTEGTNVKVDRRQIEMIREDMRNLNFYFEEDVNPSAVSEFSYSRNPYSYDVMLEKRGGRNKPKNPPPPPPPQNPPPKDPPQGGQDVSSDPNATDGADLRKGRKSGGSSGDKGDMFSAGKASTVAKIFNTQLIDSDIKKANELVPTMLSVNMWYKPDDGSDAVLMSNGIVGIKARLIPVTPDDIANHVSGMVQDSNWTLELIRATTREKSFIKDFVFAVDRAKIDALSRSRRGSSDPMWKVLERRAIGSRAKRFMGMSNPYMAITTLAVTQEDVEMIKKEFNVNLENYDQCIANLYSKLNFMAVCIADESLEVAKFVFDTGEGNWENYSFSSLEKEDRNDDYRKVINLMTKVAR